MVNERQKETQIKSFPDAQRLIYKWNEHKTTWLIDWLTYVMCIAFWLANRSLPLSHTVPLSLFENPVALFLARCFSLLFFCCVIHLHISVGIRCSHYRLFFICILYIFCFVFIVCGFKSVVTCYRSHKDEIWNLFHIGIKINSHWHHLHAFENLCVRKKNKKPKSHTRRNFEFIVSYVVILTLC